MIIILSLVATVVILAVLTIPSSASGPAPAGGRFDDLYRLEGLKEGVDWRLLKAVAQQESHEDPTSVNRGDPSYGLMGILAVTNNTGRIINRLPEIADWPPASVAELFIPERNVHYGAEILSSNIRKYGLWRGVATYNRWDSHSEPPEGPFGNQSYVFSVKLKYQALGGVV